MHRDAGWTGDPEAFGTAAAILLGDLLLVVVRRHVHLGRPHAGRRRHGPQRLRRHAPARDGRAVPRRARAGARRVLGRRGAAGDRVQDQQVHRRGAAASRRRGRRRAARGLRRAHRLRPGARRGVPAARRRPRRVRRPVGHRQAGRRRPARGQAHAAHRPGDAVGRRRAVGAAAPTASATATLDDDQVERLRGVIVATGALDQVEQRIVARTAEARAALAGPAISGEARAALDALARAATDRHA